MNEIQSKLNDIQTMINGLYDGGDVTEAARSSLQYTLNEAQKVVKNITYEPVLATGLTNEQILDEAARRKANIALQYEDYSLETWTVATKLLPYRKAYLLDDGSIRKFRIEYDI